MSILFAFGICCGAITNLFHVCPNSYSVAHRTTITTTIDELKIEVPYKWLTTGCSGRSAARPAAEPKRSAAAHIDQGRENAKDLSLSIL